MKLDKLRRQHDEINNLQAACIAHAYNKDTPAYRTLRAQYRVAFARYIRSARLALRQADVIVIGFPCLPWRDRRHG